MSPIGCAGRKDRPALRVHSHHGVADSIFGKLLVPDTIARCPTREASSKNRKTLRNNKEQQGHPKFLSSDSLSSGRAFSMAQSPKVLSARIEGTSYQLQTEGTQKCRDDKRSGLDVARER